MSVQITITKSHLFFLIALSLALVSILVIGQNSRPGEFGHAYTELALRDLQGRGLVVGEDLRDSTITAKNIKKLGPYAELNVLSAKNADAASCEFIIKSCNPGGPTNKVCSPGYTPISGEFGFSAYARDRDYTGTGSAGQCTGSGIIKLCCKSP